MPQLIPIIVAYAVKAITASYIAAMVASMIATILVSTLTSKKPKTPSGDFGFKQSAQGRTQNIRQPITDHRIIYGQAAVAGNLNFLEATGPNNEYFHLVFTLGSGGPYEEIGDIYINNELIQQGDIDEDGNITAGTYKNLIRIKKHLGAHDQTADSDLSGETSVNANFKGGGIAYVYARLKYDTDKFSDVPSIICVIKGRKVYDMRGSPTQDPDDPSTWEYSNNAALCILDYIRGVPSKIGDGTVVRRFGLNALDTSIDMDAWATAADQCDVGIPLVGSPETQEPRYSCDGVVETQRKPIDILNDMKTAFAGDVLYSGGYWLPVPGVYKTPTITLDEDDARSTITVRPKVTRRELFNAVKGVFISPFHDWQPTDYPPLTNSSYETEDNGRRIWADYDLPFTISSAAAQRIAKMYLEGARRQISVEFPAKLTAFPIQAGDIIKLNFDRYSWVGKEFFVVEKRIVTEKVEDSGPYFGVDLTLREIDESVFAWAAEEVTLSAKPVLSLPDPFTVAVPTSFAISTLTSITNQGDSIHQISLSWVAPTDQFVVSGGFIEVQWKLTTASSWQASFFVDGALTGTIIPAMLAIGVSVDARVRSVNNIGVRSSTWQTLLSYPIGSSQAGVSNRWDFQYIWEVIGSPDSLLDLGAVGDGSPTESLNLISAPSDYEDAAWTLSGFNTVYIGSPASDTTTAPDGVSLASLLTETTASGSPDEARALRYALTLNASETVYKVSIFVKPFAGSPGSQRNVRLALSDAAGTNGVTATFASVGGSPSGDIVVVSAAAFGSGWSSYGEQVDEFDNGWLRVSLFCDTGGETSALFDASLVTLTGERYYTGDGDSGVYFWHAQLEKQSLASDAGSPQHPSLADLGSIV